MNLKVQINAIMAKVKVVLFTFFIIFPNDYVTKTASNSVQMNESLKKKAASRKSNCLIAGQMRIHFTYERMLNTLDSAYIVFG